MLTIIVASITAVFTAVVVPFAIIVATAAVALVVAIVAATIVPVAATTSLAPVVPVIAVAGAALVPAIAPIASIVLVTRVPYWLLLLVLTLGLSGVFGGLICDIGVFSRGRVLRRLGCVCRIVRC